MSISSKRVAVLGAGLQGSCIALGLASHGANVDLYDENPVCMGGASLHNEGKIHLGFVYANDPSFATAELMLKGALVFEPLLRRLLGRDCAPLHVSSSFYYLVHRESLLSPDQFAAHAQKVADCCRALSSTHETSYFGYDTAQSPRPLGRSEIADLFDSKTVTAAFETCEISVDPEDLALRLRERLASEPNVRLLTDRTVVSARDHGSYISVLSKQGEVIDEDGYDYAVNALWQGRIALDAELGIKPDYPWSFRWKYFVRASSTAIGLPSSTIVLGRFGDVVNYGNGSVYLSWYPAGMICWSDAMTPPKLPAVAEGATASRVEQGTVAGLASIMPSVKSLEFQDVKVKGGWIFARGNTDIDDPSSALHHRTTVGTHRQGRYFTVNTGKFTLAPLLAEQTIKLMSS